MDHPSTEHPSTEQRHTIRRASEGDPAVATVVEVVNQYFEGARGAPGRLARAFYSSCNLHSLDGAGKLEIVPRDRFIEFAEAGLLPEHRAELLHVEVVNDMALAKVAFVFEGYSLVDFLTLLRIRGRWTIVSKVYTKLVEPTTDGR